jgi:hypothetical protein
MSLTVRREEVESWSDLSNLIPEGQKLHSVQQAYGEEPAPFFKRRSYIITMSESKIMYGTTGTKSV